MTTFDHAAETIQTSTRPAIAARVANAVSDAYRSWKNRRAFYRLGEMSDTELSDIGLTRADLHVVVDLHFTEDPTQHLGALRQDRVLSIEAAARQAA